MTAELLRKSKEEVGPAARLLLTMGYRAPYRWHRGALDRIRAECCAEAPGGGCQDGLPKGGKCLPLKLVAVVRDLRWEVVREWRGDW